MFQKLCSKEIKNNNYRRSRSKHQKSHSPLPTVKIQGTGNSARHYDRKPENDDYYRGERTNSRTHNSYKNEKNHQITKKKQYRDDADEHQKNHHKHFHEKKNVFYRYNSRIFYLFIYIRNMKNFV